MERKKRKCYSQPIRSKNKKQGDKSMDIWAVIAIIICAVGFIWGIIFENKK